MDTVRHRHKLIAFIESGQFLDWLSIIAFMLSAIAFGDIRPFPAIYLMLVAIFFQVGNK